MSSTENVSPATSLTVSDTPSSADRPLWRNEARKRHRHAQEKSRHVGQILAGEKFGNAIDMAADEMPAELVAEPERAFEIELGAALPAPRGGDAERLGGHIDGEEGTIALPAPLHDGQTGAGAGDRRADVDGRRIVAAANHQPAQAFGPLFKFKNLA